MAKLGSNQTSKFSIGTAELRIAPLSSAMRLTQANSVGLVDSVTVAVEQQSVDLEGSFPKTLFDTAIISQTATVTATLREYSRRNLQVMLGEGVSAAQPTDFSTTVSSATTAGSTTVPVSDESGFTGGDLAIIYQASDNSTVTVGIVASVSVGSLTLDPDTPTLFDYSSNDPVYLANQVAIGAVTTTNYFSVQMLQTERATGRPIGFNFWKAAISSGMTLQTNAEDFASTDLEIKILQPAASEYAAGGPLAHLNNIIPQHPSGMYFGGAD